MQTKISFKVRKGDWLGHHCLSLLKVKTKYTLRTKEWDDGKEVHFNNANNSVNSWVLDPKVLNTYQIGRTVLLCKKDASQF